MPLLALALCVPPLIEGQGSHCQGDAVVHEHHKQTGEDGDDAQANCCQVGVGKAGAGVPICHLHDCTVMVSNKAEVPCEATAFVQSTWLMAVVPVDSIVGNLSICQPFCMPLGFLSSTRRGSIRKFKSV
jgi:hypothetical protein